MKKPAHIANRLPPLQSLLAFEAAARLGSFSLAAHDLALTQSAISHQIQNLESWLGQSVFRRMGRGVQLTAAGELFLQTVKETLSVLHTGRQRIDPYGNPESILIGCTPEFASGWLLPRLGGLKARFPQLEVWLVTHQTLRDIDRIDVDIVISTQRLEGNDIESVPWLQDQQVVVGAQQAAQEWLSLSLPELLQRVPCLLEEGKPVWVDEVSQPQALFYRSMTIDDPRLLLAAVEAGMGIARMPRCIADAALACSRVVVLPHVPAGPPFSHWLMKSTLPPRTPFVHEVWAWLLESAGAASESI